MRKRNFFILTPKYHVVKSVQFIQSCRTLCDPMDCSMPGFPVHHQLPELTQIHIHRVGDANQPSHPLSSPSPTTFKSFLASGSFPVKKGYCLSPSFSRSTCNQGDNCQHSLKTGMTCVHIKSSSPTKATEHTQAVWGCSHIRTPLQDHNR